MRRSLMVTAMLSGLAAGPLFAEGGHDQVVCTVQGCKEITLPTPRYSDANAFSVQQVWLVVNEILSVSGLLPNFQVVETDEVGNAAAVIIDGERYLAFNGVWMAQYQNDPNAHWQLYGVMAHEVGHHLQGHTITGNGSRPPTELEADEYAGFTLAALGASLVEAQSLWATLPLEGSVTHPPQYQRLAAVERGWMRRMGQSGGGVPPVVQPQPTAQPQPTPQPAPTPQPEPVAIPRAEPSVMPPDSYRRHCGLVDYRNARASLCSTSRLLPQSGNSYEPGNMFDGDTSTAWVEGVDGQGVGETITLWSRERMAFNEISLRNGYTKSTGTYFKNSRVRRVLITTSEGDAMEVNLSDTGEWQTIDGLAQFGSVTWIALTIDAVFPGDKYEDTAISEIYFD